MIMQIWTEPRELPDWLMVKFPKKTSVGEREPGAAADDVILQGTRNATLASMGGTMRRAGMEEDSIAAALIVENNNRCSPPLPEDEVRGIARSIRRYPAGTPTMPIKTDYMAVLVNTRVWPAPLNEAAFHGLTGELVRAITPHTEADPVSILITHLLYFGNVVGRGYHATADAARHGTNVNAVIVGETSSARKGSSRQQVHRIYQEVDPGWTDTCIKGGMSSGEGLIWHVRDPIEKTEQIKEKGRYTRESQTHIVDEGVSDKRLIAYEPEFAQVLRVMSRETNTLSTLVRQAWDTGTLRTMTKTNPAQSTEAHISILGHITKDELLRELSGGDAANGFANRFLWVCSKRAQYLPEGGGEPEVKHLIQPLQEALNHARTERLLTRDTQARIAWNDSYEQLSGGHGSITARAEAQVLRLSVIYAALDRAKEIGLPHLEAALAVWEYCEASAGYIFGDRTGDSIADRILEGLRMSPLTRTEISFLFRRNVNSTRITQALALLVQTGLAAQHMEESDGRPSEVWTAIN